MRPPRFAQETVVLVRAVPGGTDPYGDPIPSTTTRLDIKRCLVVPNQSVEPTDRGRSGVVTGWTVYAPTGTDARFTDQVEVRGVLCEVDGEVGDWRADPLAPTSVVINATRAVG